MKLDTQEILAALKRYRSIENKRIVLHQAMKRRPDDPRLIHIFRQLTGPQQIRQAMRHGVFINYSRSDEIFALELADTLRRWKVRVWLDLVDMDYTRGWHEEVRRAIQTCGLMLAVISEESLHNLDAIEERQQFQAAGKLVLPVIRKHCDLSQAGFWLAPVDFSRGFGYGMNNLRRLLQESANTAAV